MQKNGKILLLAALIAFFMLFMPLTTEADFGDFGGGSDYGGGSYGGSDYGGGGSGGGGGSYGPDVIIAGLIITAGVIVYITFFQGKTKKSKKTSGDIQPSSVARTTGLLTMENIYTWDPNFSADALKRRLSNLYVQMQNGWSAMDISALRGDFTEELFTQYERQLNQQKGQGVINRIERIAMLDVTLTGVQKQAEMETLTAELYARITTYTVREGTDEILRGNRNEEKFIRYEWTLVRPLGMQTNTELKDAAFPCPQCGSPLNINHSAKCPYCGEVIRRAKFDWAIAQIKVLSQQTR